MRGGWLIGLGVLAMAAAGSSASGAPPSRDVVRVQDGFLEGTADPASGIRSFEGIPFAAPPIGELRWRPPQPVKAWDGVRRADRFGPRAMQPPIFGDMVFRSNGMSEDCLYLNVWTPVPAEKASRERLPVLVYFYGGGFVAGDGSEPRYDGENMARKGMVAVTVNYRLGVFGFMAHPELTQESPHHASGNYGLLDQSSALRWVRKNIAAFGGDPKKITIAGESAGSFSVSAQMASPLSRDLLAGAIGESGAIFGATLPAVRLADAERTGADFGQQIGASSLAALRALPAHQLLDSAVRANPFRFGLCVDGYFLPKRPAEIYGAGEQARVPLLAGWNAEESGAGAVLGADPATPEGLAQALRRLYGERAEEAIRAYHASTPAEARQTATDLAGDRFIAFGTWKWMDLHGKTSGKPVYRYLYTQPRPGESGAFHAVEIEYALGNLARNPVYAWTECDWRVSSMMQEYFANFVKTGNPNGAGLPAWPAANRTPGTPVMRLGVEPRVEPEPHRERYRFLDTVYRSLR
jgi:para-nitrobenzyl esterase